MPIGYLITAVYLLMWSTVGTAAKSDPSKSVGLAGLGTTAIAVGGLIVVARRGLAARTHLAAALHATFDLRGRSAATDSRGRTGHWLPRQHPWWRILIAPLSFRGYCTPLAS